MAPRDLSNPASMGELSDLSLSQPAQQQEDDSLIKAPDRPAVPMASRRGKPKPKRPAGHGQASLAFSFFRIAAVFTALIGGAILVHFARKHVVHSDRFLMPLREIEVTPLPVWIRCDLLAEVQQLAGLPDSLNTQDKNLADELSRAFAIHPWVNKVAEVRVMHPAKIRVKIEYREPVAVVHAVRSREAVDRDGVLLPFTELPNPLIYLTITGVRSTPTGPIGTQWDDPALTAGIAVADAISLHHRELGVTTIDVSTVRGGSKNPGSVFLLTERGTRVKWGHPPTENYPGEVPVPDKIDRLMKYASQHGSLDQPAGPYEIDITHWQEISIRSRVPSSARSR